MLEREVEAYLVKCVKALGGEVRKVKWIGRRNAPDRLVMLPSRDTGLAMTSARSTLMSPPRTIWAELKRPGLAATFPKDAHERAQDREHERMRAMGQRVVVIDSFAGVDQMLAG